jgi:hypothetical protein
MKESAEKLWRTAQLVLFALLPPTGAGTPPPEEAGVRRCGPREVRGGLDRLLNSTGELELYFPGCLALAAPALLFRLKRQGFSRCSVKASDQGLVVRAMR